jgi:uncharacterized protein YdeI (YjbR/CyaY-like superfamily)
MTWLAKNHDKVQEQWIGFYKRAARKPSVTWPEPVDAALCFGWIDGLRKSIERASYKIRFTQRRPRSTGSAVNVKRIKELTRLARTHAAARIEGISFTHGTKVRNLLLRTTAQDKARPRARE